MINQEKGLNMEQDEEKEKKLENVPLENIKEIGQIDIPKSKSNIHCITIIGQIEGHIILPPQNKATKYEHIIPQIIAIDESDEIDGLLLILNTMGGDVEAGLALSELITSIEKPSVSLVLGGGHSIGVPLAVSTKYSFIAPTATMTIHPIRMNGLIIGVPQMFDYFDKMQQRIISFVIKHSNISEKDFQNLMFSTRELANDVGSILVGKEAVDYGLINEIGGLKDAMSKLHSLINLNKSK